MPARHLLGCGFGLLALLVSVPAWAAPPTLTHQGRLLDATGVPVSGAHELTIGLYDKETGGQPVWTDTMSVAFDNGYYSVLLGEGEELTDDVFAGDDLFVQVAVDGQDVGGRQQVASVPWSFYARHAGTATNVSGGTVDATEILVNGEAVLDDGGLHVAHEHAWSDLKGVPDGVDDGDDDTLAMLGCVEDEVALFDGTEWGCAEHAPAHGHTWSELSDVPGDIDDGDDDTLAGLGCVEDEVPWFDGTDWGCAEHAPSHGHDWTEITGVPEDLADGEDADGLAALEENCADGESPLWDATDGVWGCGVPSAGLHTSLQDGTASLDVDVVGANSLVAASVTATTLSAGEVTTTTLRADVLEEGGTAIGDLYVDVAGDTMTGALTAAELHSGGDLTVGGAWAGGGTRVTVDANGLKVWDAEGNTDEMRLGALWGYAGLYNPGSWSLGSEADHQINFTFGGTHVGSVDSAGTMTMGVVNATSALQEGGTAISDLYVDVAGDSMTGWLDVQGAAGMGVDGMGNTSFELKAAPGQIAYLDLANDPADDYDARITLSTDGTNVDFIGPMWSFSNDLNVFGTLDAGVLSQLGTPVNTLFVNTSGDTMTGTLTAPTVNATTALQEAGTSIASKYVDVAGDTMTGALTATALHSGGDLTVAGSWTGGGSRVTVDNNGLKVWDAEGNTDEMRLGALWGFPGVYNPGSWSLGSKDGEQINFTFDGTHVGSVDSSGTLTMEAVDATTVSADTLREGGSNLTDLYVELDGDTMSGNLIADDGAVEIGHDGNGHAVMELKGAGGSTSAYIDFANAQTDDYDARLWLNGDSELLMQGANLYVSEGGVSAQWLSVDGNPSSPSGATINIGSGHSITLQGVHDPVAYGHYLPYIQWVMQDNTRAMYLGWGNTNIAGNRYVDMALENNFDLAITGGNVGIGTTDPKWSLDVNGNIRGETLDFRSCTNGIVYSCTPRECLDLCISTGDRMATIEEVFAWASAGRDHCTYMWMLDEDDDGPVRAFPMYTNRTEGGCGAMGTGNVPRIEGFGSGYAWTETQEYACACSLLK